jgi:outer membrane protein
VQQTTTFGGASLSASLTLFNGFANHYLLRQAKYARLLTHATYRRIQTEVLAQALTQFFQTIGDSIAIELQRQRIERLSAQIQRLQAQVEAGQTLSLDLLSLEAQKAREEAQYITLYNRHRENKLNLLLLMRWESLSPDSVERAQVARAEANLASAQVNALQQRQAVQRRIESAYLSWESAQVTYGAAQRSLAAAEKAYFQAQAQYEAGRLSYWAFREAFLTYTQAQIDLAQAGLDLKLRTLLLLAYTGYYQNL